MQFVSTRNKNHAVSLDKAILFGAAPDGGLYMPTRLPTFVPGQFRGLITLPEIAERLLQPFFRGSVLERYLGKLCERTFSFPVPLEELDQTRPNVFMLELFHGPTASFKDFGARFLAGCLTIIHRQSTRPLTILVATSGDTGGAAAAAFRSNPKFKVVILYPQTGVTDRQRQLMTCWGGNVKAVAVEGDFDACQRLVKAAFADRKLRATYGLTSANSINIGRLLPQMAYHVAACLRPWRRHARSPTFVIPTGNLGNALACIWVRKMGLPIAEIILATNANRTIPDFLSDGHWRPRESIPTLASAMDVGNPSNMERLQQFTGSIAATRQEIQAFSVSDEQIRQELVHHAKRYGKIWCPHTACALHVQYEISESMAPDTPWVVTATAHPSKFETIIEPLIRDEVEVPEQTQKLLALPSQSTSIEPDLKSLQAILAGSD